MGQLESTEGNLKCQSRREQPNGVLIRIGSSRSEGCGFKPVGIELTALTRLVERRQLNLCKYWAGSSGGREVTSVMEDWKSTLGLFICFCNRCCMGEIKAATMALCVPIAIKEFDAGSDYVNSYSLNKHIQWNTDLCLFLQTGSIKHQQACSVQSQ